MGIKLLESPKAEQELDVYAFLATRTQDTQDTQDTMDTSSFTTSQRRGNNNTAMLETASVATATPTVFVPVEGTQSQHQRFIAGESFFNYDACGSMRPGKEAIALFSPHYIGLAVHVLLVGFSYDFVSFGYGRLLAEYLEANNEKKVNAATYVLVWPQALAVFIGLFMDSFPLFDYRRKSYMVLGWLLSLSMYATIIAMDLLGNSDNKLFHAKSDTSTSTSSATPFAIVYLIVSLVAALGIQIGWVAAVALSIEYAQREQIYHRGKLQATLVAVYYVGKTLAKMLSALVISQGVSSDNLVSMAAIFLAGVAVFAVPFVIFRLDEEPVSKTPRALQVHMNVGQRLAHFWKFCHQNIVYRVLFFLCLHLLLLGLHNQNVRDAVKEYTKVTLNTTMWIEAVRMVAQIAGTIVWKKYLRNTNWRKLVVWGTAVFITVYVVVTVAAVLDVVRSQWFYGILLVVADVPRSWLVLFAVILATEISEAGHEGVTFAMGLSYQSLAAMAGYTLADLFPKLFGLQVTIDVEVKQDSADTRATILQAFMIVVAFNLLSFLTIRMVPRQKLDAQQMRAFGGYNRYASLALLLLFSVLLCFNLVANLITVL